MKFIIGNWKMNGTRKEKDTMFKELSKIKTKNKIVMCLPFTLLAGENHNITLGAQDVSNHNNGAYTGDISATMLKDAGAQYVIVGHSERRLYHNETNEMVKQKATMAIQNRLIPIICVGETLDERESGKTEKIIKEIKHVKTEFQRSFRKYKLVTAVERTFDQGISGLIHQDPFF